MNDTAAHHDGEGEELILDPSQICHWHNFFVAHVYIKYLHLSVSWMTYIKKVDTFWHHEDCSYFFDIT